ncbi:MAG: phage minor head protein [Deltaproteobacteria bacterium]|jgi:SPP1 gp7 family putative phage head morphogenesis protein|nr:phage minor head protein [Deltaproteobacteria bacterium]
MMNETDFKRIFNLPFTEAEDFFKNKLNIPTSAWDELTGAAHAKGFMSAGAYNADLLADLRKMVDKAIAGGMDIREFRKQFIPLVDRYGWQLKGGGPAWRSDLIWRTNTNSAYQAGRWQQFEDARIDYLKYVHNDSVMHPRPKHVALNGKILPRTDPFWSVCYPPNGFGCRCRAVAAREQEYNEGDNFRPQGWQDAPDKGWDYNVGLESKQSFLGLTNKFESLPADIAREWMQQWVNEPAFARFVEGKMEGDFPVAVLRPEDVAALGTTKQTVWLSADSLAKNKGETLRSPGHPDLTLEDYRMIPEIVDAGEVYRQKETNLIYLLRGGTLYRASIKRTEAADGNYLLSLFKTSETKAAKEVVTRMERIR